MAAKTVSYTYVLQKACELTGRVYPPTTEEASFFRTFINSALRQAWEAFDWPEQTIVQQEFFARTYSAATTYSLGAVVYFPTEEKYYQVVNASGTTGNDPTTGGPNGTLNSAYWAVASPTYQGTTGSSWNSTSTYALGDIVLYEVDQQYYQCVATPSVGTAPTNTAFWGLLNPFFRYVSQQQNPDGTTRTQELGEIFVVVQQDPRANRFQSRDVAYAFGPNGMIVLDQLAYVWIEARLLPPIYTSDPTTIPYRFAEICAYRSAGQMLRVDGKVDLGNEFLQLGEAALSDEVDKVARQEMQVRQVVVPTR
jgi:hypothetical protein